MTRRDGDFNKRRKEVPRLVPLAAAVAVVAVEAKPTPAEFVDAENLYVTDACIEYLRPLIGELPKYVKLF